MPTRTAISARAAAATIAMLSSLACSAPKSQAPDPDTRPQVLTLSPDQRERIRIEVVSPTTFFRTVETTGTVAFDGDRATQVLAPISGPVSTLLVSLGDRVRAGQPLATVASPDFAAAVSTFLKAEATARNARRIADLDEKLLANDAIARREVEQADTDAVSAEADRDAALAQLRSLGVEDSAIAGLRRGRPAAAPVGVIRSPLSGTVVERSITPGQLLEAGATPCFTVADLSHVWVMANLFEADLPSVAVGDRALISGDSMAGRLGGTVGYIASVVDPTTRSVAARIVAANPADALKRDMFVRVAIQSKRAVTGLLVPTSAVLRDDDNLPFVFIENADRSFSRRRVSVGYRTSDSLQVTTGLAAGDRVVVEGGLFMQFAQSQ